MDKRWKQLIVEKILIIYIVGEEEEVEGGLRRVKILIFWPY
jgi:hypothetical protein